VSKGKEEGADDTYYLAVRKKGERRLSIGVAVSVK